MWPVHTNSHTRIYKYMAQSPAQWACWHAQRAHKWRSWRGRSRAHHTQTCRHLDTKQTCHPSSLTHTHTHTLPQPDLWHTHTHRSKIAHSGCWILGLSLGGLSLHLNPSGTVFRECDKYTQRPVAGRFSQDSQGMVLFFLSQQTSSLSVSSLLRSVTLFWYRKPSQLVSLMETHVNTKTIYWCLDWLLCKI